MEVTQKTCRIVSVLVSLLFLGLLVSILCQQSAIALTILAISFVFACYIACHIPIRDSVTLVPANKLTILGYAMEEVDVRQIETKC